MRNLRIIQDSLQSIDSNVPVTATTWDPSSDSIIFALGPSQSLQAIELRRLSSSALGSDDTSQLIASWDALCPLPDLECDEILDIHYFSHTETTCLVLAGGDIVNVRHNPVPGEERIEIVGSVDEGITAASWAPDEELLVFTTRANTLLFMTIDFDNVASATFSAEDAELSKHVSVGWGKTETQFKGKRARALRDPTVPERVDEGVLSANDRKRTSISWRGDGAYVAINSILDNGTRRMVRVYTREGALDSVTEPVDGLEGALSWRPAGNLLAGIQRLPDKANVVFFERNGLRHGGFPLRLGAEELNTWASDIELSWNIDSSALAVCFQDRVQIWTMGNYHYYLKQEIIDSKDKRRYKNVATITWHPEQALRFAFFCSPYNDPYSNGTAMNGPSDYQHSSKALNGGSHPRCTIRILSMLTHVSKCSTAAPNDFGTVAVIDGATIKITPFRRSNVPPPMALHELNLRSPIKDVAISLPSSRIAALHEDSVTVIAFSAKDLLTAPSVLNEVALNLYETSKTCRELVFAGEDDVILLWTGQGANTTQVSCLKNQDPLDSHIIVAEDDISSTLTTSIDSTHIGLLSTSSSQSTSFATLEVEPRGSVAVRNKVSSLGKGVVQAETVLVEGHQLLVKLCSNGALYTSDKQVSKNCTSFLLTPSHIIFTTTTHLLKFIHLDPDPERLEVPPDEPETDERCRSIERGARLVTVMPSAYALVMQMPRGNLETIYPRAMVLASIRRNIADRQYRKAFLTCRSQRVDMNIIHDYAPEQFHLDVAKIVDQLKTVEYVDLLLSQLSDVDVSKVLYRETLPKDSSAHQAIAPASISTNEPAAAPGKVNSICDAFLAVLASRRSTHLQSIITANVCKQPPDIDSGLSVVSSLRAEDETRAESALEHMCFLTDVNRVYEVALGSYDLDLTLMVAQQSQKDPREYLPYLQELQNMPQIRRQFSIDNDLKRYAKALAHLHELGPSDFEEFKSYTRKHDLYTQALSLHRYDKDRTAWRELLRLQADHLLSRNRFKDAAIAYEALSDYEAALSAYISATLWRPALSTAALIPLPADRMQELATSLRDTALEGKDYTAAASIARDYLADIPNAIRYLVQAYKPAEALRLATLPTSKHTIPDLLRDVLDPALTEACSTLTETTSDFRSQIVAQSNRLAELRALKARDPLRFLTGEREATGAEGDIPDDISLAPTSTSVNPSLFTRYSRGGSASGTFATGVSRKTSKNRKREERKRARGKKGSIYEEEYLVNSLERLVGRVNEVGGDVREVVEVCCRRSDGGGELWERGGALQRGFEEVVVLLGERMPEVFKDRSQQGEGQGTEGEVSAINGEQLPRPMGGDGVLWDHMEDGRVRKEMPVVKNFEGLSLLS